MIWWIAFIGVLVSILALFWFYFIWPWIKSKPFKEYSLSDFDLNEPAQLCFEKESNGEYSVLWYNPVRKCWWTMPEIYHSYTSGPWYLWSRGGYGAYDSSYIKVDHQHIYMYKAQFKTIGHIKDHFDSINKLWDEVQRRKQRAASLPDRVN